MIQPAAAGSLRLAPRSPLAISVAAAGRRVPPPRRIPSCSASGTTQDLDASEPVQHRRWSSATRRSSSPTTC